VPNTRCAVPNDHGLPPISLAQQQVAISIGRFWSSKSSGGDGDGGGASGDGREGARSLKAAAVVEKALAKVKAILVKSLVTKPLRLKKKVCRGSRVACYRVGGGRGPADRDPAGTNAGRAGYREVRPAGTPCRLCLR
jgi:hypothetical protein